MYMIEMLFYLFGDIKEFDYHTKDLLIIFKNGIHRFLQDIDNKSLNYYVKDEIEYI